MQTKTYRISRGPASGKTIQYVEDYDGKVVGKECNECGKIKKLSEFYAHKRFLFGCLTECKDCVTDIKRNKYANDVEFREKCNERYANNPEFREKAKNRSQERYYNGKTDYWTIYLIDNFDGKGNHYVGQTKNLPHRLSDHRSRGADTSYYLIMDTAPTQKLADEYEAAYHAKGYCGAKGCPKYRAMKENYRPDTIKIG